MRFKLLTLTLMSVVLSGITHSQEKPESDVKIGMGVGLQLTGSFSPITNYSAIWMPGSLDLFIPIDFAGHGRVEPTFGYFYNTNKSTHGSVVTYTDEYTYRIVVVGLRLGYVIPLDESLTFVVGPHTGIFLENTKRKTSETLGKEVEQSRSYFGVGLHASGEYFISRHFSIGGEIRLDYLKRGEETITPTPAYPEPDSGTILSTSSICIVRWFF